MSSRVASLSTSPFLRMPQWPCVVYSQKQRSATTRTSGRASLSARNACCTMPVDAQAWLPAASFRAGIPKRSNERIPLRLRAEASRSRTSIDIWYCPGIDVMGIRMFRPGRTKSGAMKRRAAKSVSWIRERIRGFVRRRRKRVAGKDMRGFYRKTGCIL